MVDRTTPRNQRGFNPRTHTRCDATTTNVTPFVCLVSIHAPTRGATIATFIFSRYIMSVSIHAPTRGATESKRLYSEIEDSFNPRTHTRCDFSPRCTNVPVWSFNPRTHTRCDKTYIDKHPWDKEFQSTHPHEVRPSTSV